MKVSKDFFITEFVPRLIWNEYGSDSIRFIDLKLIYIAQYIRDWFNQPITINNWFEGGKYNESGYRLPGTVTGSWLSAHKARMAIDIKFSSIETNRTVYEAITGSIKTKFYRDLQDLGLTAVESNALTKDGWLHLTTENWGLPHIKIIGG